MSAAPAEGQCCLGAPRQPKQQHSGQGVGGVGSITHCQVAVWHLQSPNCHPPAVLVRGQPRVVDMCVPGLVPWKRPRLLGCAEHPRRLCNPKALGVAVCSPTAGWDPATTQLHAVFAAGDCVLWLTAVASATSWGPWTHTTACVQGLLCRRRVCASL